MHGADDYGRHLIRLMADTFSAVRVEERNLLCLWSFLATFFCIIQKIVCHRSWR